MDHWYSRKINLVKWQCSGTHHRVVQGIGLTTLVWTNRLPNKDAEHIPIDYRVYTPPGGLETSERRDSGS